MTFEVTDPDNPTGTITLTEPPKDEGTLTVSLPKGGSVTVDLVPGQNVYEDIPLPKDPAKNPYGDKDTTYTATVDGGGYAKEHEPDTDNLDLPVTPTLGIPNLFGMEDGVVVTIKLKNYPSEKGTVTYEINGETFTANVRLGQNIITHPDIIPIPPKGPYAEKIDIEVKVTDIQGCGFADPRPGDPAEGVFGSDPTQVTLTFDIERNENGEPVGTIKLSDKPEIKGTLTITGPDGQEITIDVKRGVDTYTVSLPDANPDNPYDNPSVKDSFTAKLSDNVFPLPVASDDADLDYPGTPTATDIRITESDGEVAITITLENAPKEDAEITYTVNGEIFTQTVKAGQTEITHPESMFVPVGNPYGGKLDVDVQVNSVTGGGFARVIPDQDSGSWDAPLVEVQIDLKDLHDNGDGLATGTVTLDWKPVASGKIMLTDPDGNVMATIDVVSGQDTYENVVINHGKPASPCTEPEFDLTASMTGGGFKGNVIPDTEPHKITGVATQTGVSVPELSDDGKVIAEIMLGNEPIEDAEVTYTVTIGNETKTFTKTIAAGETGFTIDPSLELFGEIDGAKPDVRIEVVEVKGGGFLKVTGSENHGQLDFGSPTIEFETPDPEPVVPDNPDFDPNDPQATKIANTSTATLDEANLENGTRPDAELTHGHGSFTVHTHGLDGNLVIGDADIALGGKGNLKAGQELPEISSGHVRLTIAGIENGVVSYEYALADAETHPENDNLIRNFDIRLETAAGSCDGRLNVKIKDDAPIADDAEAANLTFDQAEISGNATDLVTKGADADSFFKTDTITDDYGTFAIDETGSWTFIANADKRLEIGYGQSESREFSYTYADADGDPVTATITVSIAGTSKPTVDIGTPDEKPVDPSNPEDPDATAIAATSTLVVNEAGLPGGTREGEEATGGKGSFTVYMNGVSGTVTVAGHEIPLMPMAIWPKARSCPSP